MPEKLSEFTLAKHCGRKRVNSQSQNNFKEENQTHTEMKRCQHCQTSATVHVKMPQRKRTTENHLEKDLERKMWTVGFSISWRQQHKTVGGDEWSVAYDTLGVTGHRSSQAANSNYSHCTNNPLGNLNSGHRP